MSKKPNLKLVVNNRFPVEREAENECETEDEEIKINWWSTLTWHTKIQIFVFCVLITAFVTGIALHLLDVSRVGTPLWMLSSFCLFLIWVLEYWKRMDTDHIKGY